MASLDKVNSSKEAVLLTAQTIASATTVNGNWINTLPKGEQFQGVLFTLATAAITNAPTTLVINVQEADLADFSDAANVDPQFLVLPEGSTLATLAASLIAANSTCRLGYVGQKTYVRVQLTTTGSTINFAVSGMALLTDPRFAPTSPSTVVGSVGY